jgi:hypothetical protein
MERDILKEYLKNPVHFNQCHSIKIQNDADANGESCFELAETMFYLFAGEETKESLQVDKLETYKTHLVQYVFQGKTQSHMMIIYMGIVYEMLDGRLYQYQYMLSDYDLIEHASKLCKEQLHVCDKVFYKLKDYKDSIADFDKLN